MYIRRTLNRWQSLWFDKKVTGIPAVCVNKDIKRSCNIKERLNKEQQKAVNYTDGPLLIFAGAGSGKTMVIVHRIAKLLKEGVKPFNIVAVTFTNKAAQEMRDRIKELAGPEGSSVWISTFHSLATKILRFDGKKSFTIYDEKDQMVVIKDCLQELDIDPKKFPPAGIREMISNAKNNLVDAESFKINASAASDSARYIIGDVYQRYEKVLIENGGYDFADLLVETIGLFKDYPEILKKYRQKFKYIMVDEYQDTNYAQYTLIRFLTPPHDNICVVGDDDQCLVKGTEIECPAGQKSVESFRKGEKLKSSTGHGKSGVKNIDNISKRKYSGRILRITTKKGRELCLTPNHIMFGKLKPAAGLYYVYLMYKKKLGFRIGITQGVRSKRKSNQIVNGLRVRLNQEKADKIWILKTCKEQNSAIYYEQYYAFEFGVPTSVFYVQGRKMVLEQKKIDRLFHNIDTVSRAQKLMKSMDIDPRFPHITAGGYVNKHTDRKIINFTMFGEGRCSAENVWHAHRIQLNSSDKKLKEKLNKKGFNVRRGKKNTWRVETSRKNYGEGIEFIKKLFSCGGTEIVKKARMTSKKSYLYMPAAHLRPEMAIPVYENGQIKEDKVKEVKSEDYDGYVYDMSVPDLRNYIAGGIVVHNSIYSWRGADIRNILEFEKHFKDAKTIKLEQNYRSTGNILKAAHNVIKNNPSRKEKKLWTKKEKGMDVKHKEFFSNRDEARSVVAESVRLIEDEGYSPSDIAIFYRVNAQSRSFEDSLRKARLYYKILGGVKFYSRKEVKDILGYLKVLVNPKDDVSMMRVINRPPRGIGKKTIELIREAAAKENLSVYELIRNGSAELSETINKKLFPVKDLFGRLEKMRNSATPADLVKVVIELSGYHRWLDKKDDITARSRIENIEELVSAFAEEENKERDIQEILNEISLVSDVDELDFEREYITLMTMHIAKGLEFKVVFLTGLEEDLFPHYDALSDPTQMEEERRLCYVGMTRAKEMLYLTSASQRMLYGQTRWHIPSRFIDEALGGGGDDGFKEYVYD